ncbi:MAG TPA: hypothetical protein VLM38_12170 [Blastocatellia bacterium]|nr:hypothetical protein [Blastocatellia bacterium]
MSDYLTTLAARGLNAAPVVMPRLASLFEPPSLPAGSATQSTFEVENSQAEIVSKSSSQTEEPDEIPEKVSRVGDLTVPRVDLSALAERQRKKPDEDESPGDDQRRSRVDRAAKVVSAVHPSTPATVNQVENHDSMRLPRNLEDTGALNPTARSAPERVTGQTSTHENRPSLESELKRIASEPLASFKPPRSVERTHVPALITVAPRQAVLPIKPAVRTVTHAPANAEAPPAIRVTIGRVDVKAIMPQTPAPRPAPARPRSTSLADYLKQREGGKR